MGITRKPSGRFIVGLGASDLNEYKEVGALKDLFIQLTSDGCTDESQNYLNYLADYAEYHSGLGEPIMPPGVNVWLSNNGTTTAVEADDLSLEDGTYTICGITCTDGEWDFSNAGQQGGGGGSDLPEVDSGDNGKLLTVVSGEWAAANSPVPTVNSTDNGKVLTVVEGAWSAASASGGGLLVTMTETETGYSLDKNYNEISTALSRGINPVFVFYSGEGGETDCIYYWPAEVYAGDGEYGVYLCQYNEGSLDAYYFSASSATGILTYTAPVDP